MIDWVHQACESWGRAFERRIHDTGFPPRSPLGRLIDEGPGACSGSFHQHFPEFLEGDARDVSIAVRKMFDTMAMEQASAVIVAHYLFHGKAKGKAHALRIDLPTYWRALHSAHCFLAACIESPDERSTGNKSVATL